MHSLVNSVSVVFRKFKDDGTIVALFPSIPWNANGDCTSYQHIGQHGAADYTHCVRISVPANEVEYSALKAELERIGYSLRVISKYIR